MTEEEYMKLYELKLKPLQYTIKVMFEESQVYERTIFEQAVGFRSCKGGDILMDKLAYIFQQIHEKHRMLMDEIKNNMMDTCISFTSETIEMIEKEVIEDNMKEQKNDLINGNNKEKKMKFLAPLIIVVFGTIGIMGVLHSLNQKPTSLIKDGGSLISNSVAHKTILATRDCSIA